MNYNIEWNATVIEDCRASNDEDLGEICDMANGHILVQMDRIDKETFSIPKDQAESYDSLM